MTDRQYATVTEAKPRVGADLAYALRDALIVAAALLGLVLALPIMAMLWAAGLWRRR